MVFLEYNLGLGKEESGIAFFQSEEQSPLSIFGMSVNGGVAGVGVEGGCWVPAVYWDFSFKTMIPTSKCASGCLIDAVHRLGKMKTMIVSFFFFSEKLYAVFFCVDTICILG